MTKSLLRCEEKIKQSNSSRAEARPFFSWWGSQSTGVGTDLFFWAFLNLWCTTRHLIKYNCRARADANRLETLRINRDNLPMISSLDSHPNNWTLGIHVQFWSSISFNMSSFVWAKRWNLLVIPNPVNLNWCIARKAQPLKFTKNLWKASYWTAAQALLIHRLWE